MFQSLVNTLFGCAHSRTTFPMTPGRGSKALSGQNAAHLGTYVVCLDCGKEFAYDWKTMRVGQPIPTPVAAAPIVEEVPATVQQPVQQAQPMYR